MTHLAPDDQVRLEQLRATDTTGLYASDEPSTGTSSDGSLSVTIDPTLRVVSVQVHAVDQVRGSDALDAAVSTAYTAALAARLPAAEDRPDGSPAARPVARRVRRVSAAPTPARLNRHQSRYHQQPPLVRRTPVTGVSDNECVTVTLGPAGPRGVVAADPGWLAQTSGPRLAVAVTEAFQDAHTRRDQA